MKLPEEQLESARKFARRLRDERFDKTDSALADALGVHQSTISRFLSGESGTRTPVLLKIAKLARVELSELLGLSAHAPLPEAPSPAAPPVSETRVSNDAIDDLVNGAWDPGLHQPSDVRPVVEALESQAALLRGFAEPLDVVRALLDTVADARLKGKKITAEDLPAVALGTTKQRLISAEQKIAEYMAQARMEALHLGVEPRETPHPALLEAQRKTGIKEAGAKPPKRK